MWELIQNNSTLISGLFAGVGAFFHLKSDVKILRMQVAMYKAEVEDFDKKIQTVWGKFDAMNEKLVIVLEKLARIEGSLNKP